MLQKMLWFHESSISLRTRLSSWPPAPFLPVVGWLPPLLVEADEVLALPDAALVELELALAHAFCAEIELRPWGQKYNCQSLLGQHFWVDLVQSTS